MKPTLATILLACSLLAPLRADGERAPVIHFGQPEVLKLGWNTRSPRAADFNGDGLMDIALINQDQSRIEFLLQGKDGPKPGRPEASSRRDLWNPLLEVSRFEKQSLVIGSTVYSLAVGDFDGDGRPDIAYTTDEKQLVVQFHGKTMSDWSRKREFQLDSTVNDGDSLLAVDLNGDQRTDLALLTQTRLMVFLQGKNGDWLEPQSYALTEPCAGLRAADLDGDGRTDLFATTAGGDAVLVRLQTAEGSFSKEWRLPIQPALSWAKPVKLAGGTALAWLQKSTGMIELARLTQSAAAADSIQCAALRQAIPPSDSKVGATAYGDLTGDGIPDIVIAEPKRARVWVFAGQKDGGFAEGREYPSLSGVEAMAIADIDGDKRPELIVLSPAEKTVAWARWDGTRLGYPQAIHQSEDALTAMTAGPFGFAEGNAVVCIREGKSKPALLTFRWSAAEKSFTSATNELTAPPAKISAIRLVDADQDGHGDIALFSATAPMQLLLSRADTAQPLKRVEGLPDSLTAKLPPGALTLGDVDGDGRPELIAAREQLARAFKVDVQGRAKFVEQFNAPDGAAQLAAALVVPGDNGGPPTVLLLDSNSHSLHELRPGDDRVYRVARTRRLGEMDIADVRVSSRGGGRTLLTMGRRSFETMPLSGPGPRLERHATFASELRDAHPNDLLAAPFNGRATDDLLLIDSKRSRVFEFFRSTAADPRDWRSFLFFRIFQTDPHYRGRTGSENEPHDYAVMDINGDGKADLCLLVHDRLLLYVQE